MANLKALILDDDKDNIDLLEIYLKKYCNFFCNIYKATSLEEGIYLCLEHKPDILFLDIDLGEEKNSFTLIENCLTDCNEIIFISSYNEYALKAIKINACAYLMKPIIPSELVQAVDKSIKNIENKKLIKYANQLSDDAISKNQNIIAIASIEKIDLIKVNEIAYCQADGKYTRFFLKNGTEYTSSRNIGEYEQLLQNPSFFRVHHKYIVNIKAIISVNKKDGFYCELKGGKTIPIAKRRQEAFNKFLRLKS
jgi:two-component system LytT family response regulator